MPIENDPSFFNGFPNQLPLSSTFKQPSNSFDSLCPSTGYQIMPFMSSPMIPKIINYQPTFSLLPNSSYQGYNNTMKRSFQCKICNIKFPTAQAYGGHMSYHSKLKKAQEREHEEVKNEGMNIVAMKGKKHGRVEETEKRKRFGYGSDEYSEKSESCLGEGRCSDFKKKRKRETDGLKIAQLEGSFLFERPE